MSFRYKPSRKKAREFAQTMDKIALFCSENGIEQSKTSDSYYFMINGQKYRVSNHTVAASNAKAYNFLGEKLREEYHKGGEDDDTIYITAGKTRIIEIYNDLKAGYKLDKRGNRKEAHMSENNVKHPCQGCVYYTACGESGRTMPCEGRKTKSEQKKEKVR